MGEDKKMLSDERVRWLLEAYADEPPDWSCDPMNEGAVCRCGWCGAWGSVVRPGKWQCDACQESSTGPTAFVRALCEEVLEWRRGWQTGKLPIARMLSSGMKTAVIVLEVEYDYLTLEELKDGVRSAIDDDGPYRAEVRQIQAMTIDQTKGEKDEQTKQRR